MYNYNNMNTEMKIGEAVDIETSNIVDNQGKIIGKRTGFNITFNKVYDPYVVNLYELAIKHFDNNPLVINHCHCSHYECSFSLQSIGIIDELPVDTYLIFRRVVYGEQKIPLYNARLTIDC